MTDIEPIAVEVVYALPHKQKLLSFLVTPGTTALQAAEKSGICQFFPELDLANVEMGIFSQTLGVKGIEPPASYILKSGDRVEIYRPLVSDPKEVRRRLAARQKAEAENKAQ
ncbi:MAG: RnfH family protein [Marinagarivorans sp.]|nr:RnfH family protein [Marinagarivorans sp.]